MTERVLGQSGSPRRRWTLLIPVVAAIVLAAFYIPSAVAVHDNGLFELDRNAQDPAPAALPDDWEALDDGAGHALAFSTILPDIGGDGGTQFQGGGSKDDLDIDQWLWKAGEPLDKDDITNSYAAAYSNTVDTTNSDPGDLIIYFGLDRFSTAGSAQVGFWFLQDETFGTSNTPAGGGFEFNGVHQDGDVLVQSNFSNGGVISNLTVFKWQSGGLVEVTGVNASDCIPGVGDDKACATVNQSPTPSPWPYVPKANEGTSGTFPTSAFFEGGINITQLVGSTACFAAFVAETRSSTPFDSRLKDFVVGEIDTCPGAMRILKKSTKGTNPLVTDAGSGALFSVTGAESFTVRDNNDGTPAGSKSDSDPTFGEVCVDGVAPGSYTVNEDSPPSGYGDASQTDVPYTVVNGSTCDTAAEITFMNPPLGEFVINYNDLGSGETSADISCTGLTPTPPDGSSGFNDDTETYTNLTPNPSPGYSCTIKVDP